MTIDSQETKIQREAATQAAKQEFKNAIGAILVVLLAMNGTAASVIFWLWVYQRLGIR